MPSISQCEYQKESNSSARPADGPIVCLPRDLSSRTGINGSGWVGVTLIMISTPIYQAIFQKTKAKHENENESRCQSEKSLANNHPQTGESERKVRRGEGGNTYIYTGYKARVIKQWWCARIHIFKMDGWANEWIIWKYAPTLRMGRASGGVKKKVRGIRRGDTWQDCCEARHVKKFLTSGLEACLLSLSLAPARQHIFHSPLDWAWGVGSGGGVSGCCCTLHSWTGGQNGTRDVHELWLSVFLKVLRATPRRRGTFISFNFLEIFFSPLYNFLPCFLSLLSSLAAGGFGFGSAVCVFFPWTRLKFFLIRFTDY